MEMMLQIIPVIDIRDGIVVHACGGNRQYYPPLKSILTDSVEPTKVITDLLAWLPFQRFYIADLDAIEQGIERLDFYRALCRQFSQTEFWLDSGIQKIEQISAFNEISNLRLVVGSETLQDTDILTQADIASRLILSLDKKNGLNLGAAALFSDPARWTQNMILMNLDRVGTNKGPDLQWLQSQQCRSQNKNWFLAGGIRNEVDLIDAQKMAASGVLLASALHTGAINKKTLSCLMKPI